MDGDELESRGELRKRGGKGKGRCSGRGKGPSLSSVRQVIWDDLSNHGRGNERHLIFENGSPMKERPQRSRNRYRNGWLLALSRCRNSNTVQLGLVPSPRLLSCQPIRLHAIRIRGQGADNEPARLG